MFHSGMPFEEASLIGIPYPRTIVGYADPYPIVVRYNLDLHLGSIRILYLYTVVQDIERFSRLAFLSMMRLNRKT